MIVNSEQCSIPIFSHFSCSKVTLLSPSAEAIWSPIWTPKRLWTQLQNRTVYKVISNKQSHSSSNDYFFIEQMRQRQRRHDTTSCAQSFSESNFSLYTILPIYYSASCLVTAHWRKGLGLSDWDVNVPLLWYFCGWWHTYIIRPHFDPVLGQSLIFRTHPGPQREYIHLRFSH